MILIDILVKVCRLGMCQHYAHAVRYVLSETFEILPLNILKA